MIYLKNPAGLCANLALVPLVSIHTLRLLRSHASEGLGSPEFQELVGILDGLPLEEEMSFNSEAFTGPKDFPGNPVSSRNWLKCTMAGVYAPEIFKSNTSADAKDLWVQPTAEGFGWDQVDRIAVLYKKVANEFKDLGLSLGQRHIASLQKALKKQADWTVVELTPASMLQSDACAVYLVDGRGFVNDKGNPVPLGGARLFESTAAAERTIQSRGWQNAVVVSAKIQVEGLSPEQKHLPDNLGLLGAAISHKQAEQLRSETIEVQPAAARRTRL